MNYTIHFGEEMAEGLRIKRVAFLPVYLSLLLTHVSAKWKEYSLREVCYIECPRRRVPFRSTKR